MTHIASFATQPTWNLSVISSKLGEIFLKPMYQRSIWRVGRFKDGMVSKINKFKKGQSTVKCDQLTEIIKVFDIYGYIESKINQSLISVKWIKLVHSIIELFYINGKLVGIIFSLFNSGSIILIYCNFSIFSTSIFSSVWSFTPTFPSSKTIPSFRNRELPKGCTKQTSLLHNF